MKPTDNKFERILEALGPPYYRERTQAIYCGDCREYLPRMPEGAVDLVLTDPPYGIDFDGKRYKGRDGGVSHRPGSYVFEDTPEYVQKVCVPVVELSIDLSSTVAVTPGTRNCWLYPRPSHIGCIFSPSNPGRCHWGFTCCHLIFYYGSDPYLRRGMGSRPDSFFLRHANDSNQQSHPCAKPMRAWSWLVERASFSGDVILDPFLGSGTTLRAAKDLCRYGIGIELEERYCEIAAKRLGQEVFDF